VRDHLAGAMRPEETAAWYGHSALAPSAHGGRPLGGNPGTGPRGFSPPRSASHDTAKGGHPSGAPVLSRAVITVKGGACGASHVTRSARP
jgi:hypothetical protein